MRKPKPVGLNTYLVEIYRPGSSDSWLAQAALRVQQATETLSGPGNEISYRSAIFVRADEASFCLFDAASADDVAKACRLAELPFDRILEVVQIGGPAA